MLSVDYLPGARRDFDESFDWYAAQSVPAAARFTEAVDEALRAVAADPERFVAVDHRHQECPVSRFPYRIVYRIVENHVLVVAIAHAKRRPGYWKDRS